MASSLTYKAVAPASVPTPPSPYYALFISDGSSSTTAGSYYKKDSAGTVTALVPSAFTAEDAQDAVGGILTDSATVDFTYDDAGNTISAVVPNDAITNTKLANMPAMTIKGNNTTASADPVDLTLAQVEQILNFGIASRSVVSQVAVSNVTTETAYAAFTIPANSLSVGDVIHVHANLNGTRSATAATLTPRIRVGAVGSGAGGAVAAQVGPLNTIAAAVASTCAIDAYLTVRSIGAAGTIIGDIMASGPLIAATTTASAAVTTAVAIDTTQARDVVLTLALSAAQLTGGTIQVAFIEHVA